MLIFFCWDEFAIEGWLDPMASSDLCTLPSIMAVLSYIPFISALGYPLPTSASEFFLVLYDSHPNQG